MWKACLNYIKHFDVIVCDTNTKLYKIISVKPFLGRGNTGVNAGFNIRDVKLTLLAIWPMV